jgi:NNP family nitrate/nitrite transporter-like MFS transporter
MKLLPLFIFWGLWFVNFSTRTIFSPILPLIEDTLSLSHGEAGGLFTSLSIGYSIALLVIGRFVSAWGYKRMVVMGFIGVGLIFLIFQWAESYLTFHILFFLIGIATGTYIPSMLPIITETYDPSNWGKAIGFHDSAASLSFFSIPILVAFGLRLFSWRILLLILGAASSFLPIYFWKVSIEPKHETSQQRAPVADLFKKRTVWIMGILWIFASASSIGVYSIFPLYLIKEQGIDFHLANTLFGISRVGGVFFSIMTGFLFDRYGYRTMLMLSLCTTGLSTIGLSLSSTLPLILITLILQAILSLTFFPAGLATISKLTPLSERSMAFGVIISIGVIFGMGFTPFLLGIIADHLSFQVGILWLGIMTTISSLGVRFLGEGIGARSETMVKRSCDLLH